MPNSLRRIASGLLIALIAITGLAIKPYTSQAASDIYVYQDALNPEWINASWAASLNMQSTAKVWSGSYAMQASLGAYGAASLHAGSWGAPKEIGRGLYSYVQFAVYGGNTGLPLQVLLENDQGGKFPILNYGTIPSNTWRSIKIPFNQLNPASLTVNRIDFINNSGTNRTVYLDDIKLLGPEDTTPPTISISSSTPVADSPITLTATAFDQSGIQNISVYFNNALVKQCTSSPCVYTSGNLTAGSNHTFAATATDASASKLTAADPATGTKNLSVPVPLSNNTIIYDDSIRNPWVDSSWSTEKLNTTDQKVSGTNSLKLTFGAWGGLSLHSGPWGSPIPINGQQLTFDVFPTTTSPLGVLLENEAGQSFPIVPLTISQANTWQKISVPLSQLNPQGQIADRLDILNQSTNSQIIYIDNLQIVRNANADTTPPQLDIQTNTQGGNVTLTANASDASGIQNVDIFVDNVKVKTCIQTTCAQQMQYSTAGTHTYYATATDNSSLQNVSRVPASGTLSFNATPNLSLTTGPWVSAYYAGWQQGWNNSGYMPAQEIDYSAVTHIIHFAAIPNADGTLDDQGNGVTAANSAAAVAAAHAAGKKILISIGGTETAAAFRSASSSTYRTKFVNSIVDFMRSRGYDGVDLDWEPLQSSDTANYVALTKELRNALNNISPRPLLTTAVAGQPSIFAQLVNEFDQINVMTYDMAGTWDGWVSWHNAPLHNGGFTFPSTGWPLPSTDSLIQSFKSAGVPANKLGIGLDFYGYIWQGGINAQNPANGITAPKQSWTTAPQVRYIPYSSLVTQYNVEVANNPNLYWDTAAGASYLSLDNAGSANDAFVSFDGLQTAREKVNYIRENGLGGMIIWELGGGYVKTAPVGERDHVLQVVKKALLGN